MNTKMTATLRAVGVALGILILGVALLVATAPAGAARAGATPLTCAENCYSLTVSPPALSAGDTQAFSFDVTSVSTRADDSPAVAPAWAQITAPTGFAIISASIASGPGTVSSTTATSVLVTAPGTGTTVTVTASAPCSAESYKWGFSVQQTYDSDDSYGLDSSSAGALSGTVSGHCSLAFTSSGEPAGTAAGSTITSALNSSGGPVGVAVLDGAGNLLVGSTAPVTVALATNPGSGTLSGTTTEGAVSGVASFANLSVDQAAPGYSLIATSPGIISATSSYFTIFGTLQACTSSCSASSSTSTTSATVNALSSPPGDYLGLGLGGVNLTCPGYTSVTSAANFDVLDASGGALSTVTLRVRLDIAKSLVESSGREAVARWQICYASTTPFTALPGSSGTLTVGSVTYYTGLLPECRLDRSDNGFSNDRGLHGRYRGDRDDERVPPPCVVSKHKTEAGDIVIRFLAVGDPIGRG